MILEKVPQPGFSFTLTCDWYEHFWVNKLIIVLNMVIGRRNVQTTTILMWISKILYFWDDSESK